MSVYERHVLPRLIDLAMGSKAQAAERAQVVPLASGVVLEVGIGSGRNLPFYGPGVERLYGLDPSRELWRLAGKRVERAPVRVQFIRASAERIPLKAMTVDTAVMTWTLCSIPDPERALREVRRVLKPDGRLLFVEHGRSPDRRVVAWQDRLDPIWTRVAGGCHLNRKIGDLMAGAGFQLSQMETRYGGGPRPFAYLYRGLARPSGATRVAAASHAPPGHAARPRRAG
jgi:ubiquinone/menaquinone biosynthesis C-methylase UbiE